MLERKAIRRMAALRLLQVAAIALAVVLLWAIFMRVDAGNDAGLPPGEELPDGQAPGVRRQDDGTIKVGLTMDTLQEERWIKDQEMFGEAVKALGAEFIVMTADSDDAKQIEQAETLIGMGVDILVVVPHDAEAAATIVNKAHAAGIKVLSYDRLVRNADVDLYVSFDNERVGELQAEAITKRVPAGKYVYIGGPETDYNAHLVKKGVFNVLQPYIDRGEITIVFDQWTRDWQPANARDNMRIALEANEGRIDAVIAGNDGTAGGAIEALAEWGLAGQVPVAGQDAELAAAQRIVAGTQTMTVYKPIRQLAEVAAELAVKMAKGETPRADRLVNNGKLDVPSVLLTPIAVNADNIDETIIADGFHAREEVYKHIER
ncbi:ABC-type ribose transport system, periplasmic component [Thermobacillus xylanilyticus]|uniref:ABC-type ribose transport system, periplasmic component n=1 Tax=Thermobacillus xylanilyticus TaxID=76633 RepID=A0ABN7SBN3_THEXY|nr:substrate-binding domain-containing protein [Thermobacillus xylanilyticus]CAG5092848.1 ABC-type ribose transport system, periplasmic component [Thermobacillus xylanilyticus]